MSKKQPQPEEEAMELEVLQDSETEIDISKTITKEVHNKEAGATRKSGLDHPFSIESILNGTTKRRKTKRVNAVDSEQNEPLPLNALEKFTSKAFSTMKSTKFRATSHNNPTIEDEEPMIVRERLKLPPNKPIAKKGRRKARTCFTNQQIYELERRFLYQKYLSPQDRDELSEMLNLSNAQVITWFQNRRAKLKRDIEEMRNDVAATRSLQTRVATCCTEYHCGRCGDCR